MLGLFRTVSPNIRLYKPKVLIDSGSSRLHYRLTFIFLMGCCLFITATQFVGDPIRCLSDVNGDLEPQKKKTIETYCWVSSTFTLPEALDKEPFENSPYILKDIGPDLPGQRKYHAYYQWVPFALFCQALLFYLPHYLWKAWEGHKMKSILMNLHLRLLPCGERDKEIEDLAHYLQRNLNYNHLWMLKYLFCELLGFTVAIGNIYLTDAFLNNEFTSLGFSIFKQIDEDFETRRDILVKIFPRMTKCLWHSYGPSGTIQTNDIYCLLAWNNINEKVYVFMWFWFMFVAICSSLRLLYLVITFAFVAVREKIFILNEHRHFDMDMFNLVMKKLHYADWLLLDQIQTNLTPDIFGCLINKMGDKLIEEKKMFASNKNEKETLR